MNQTQTEKAREALAGFLRTPIIEPRADAVENLLRRADARALDRLRNDKPLTGFGGEL
jgi:hypothetical protein